MAVTKIGLYHDKRMASPWIVRWFGESNERGSPRRYSQAFKLKRDAVAFQAAKQAELDGGGQRDPAKVTLEELCEAFLDVNQYRFRQSTLGGYLETIRQLKDYFGPSHLVCKVTRHQAERFVATRVLVHRAHARKPKTLSDWGRNRHARNARAIFSKAVEWEYRKDNPFKGLEKSKPDRRAWHHITPDEFKALLSVVPDAVTRTLYSVMYGAGLRYGEAVNLTWNGRDVDFERNRINIAERATTKELPPYPGEGPREPVAAPSSVGTEHACGSARRSPRRLSVSFSDRGSMASGSGQMA